MHKDNIFKNSNSLDEKNISLWFSEAVFGYSQIKNELTDIKKNANIMEVGCGSGILLSTLAEEFPNNHFSGLEPFGNGFTNLKKLNLKINKDNIDIQNKGYEEYVSKKKYDFIYCINVFEHVNDWRNFLCWAYKNLNNGGTFMVLCPNYGFPYESHFKFPILINKAITFKLFKKRIKYFEKFNNNLGLWDSLNFVKKKEIKNFLVQEELINNFSMFDDLSIVDIMIERAMTDNEFKKRQPIFSYAANIIYKINITSAIKCMPNVLPYMKLRFDKPK